MFLTLFYLTIVFFAIGGIAILILNKRSDATARKKRWVKYAFYLVVVSTTVWCIQFGAMPYLAVVLLAIGAYEILAGWRTSGTSVLFLVVPMLFYVEIAFVFSRFSRLLAPEWLFSVYTIVFTFYGFL